MRPKTYLKNQTQTFAQVARPTRISALRKPPICSRMFTDVQESRERSIFAGVALGGVLISATHERMDGLGKRLGCMKHFDAFLTTEFKAFGG